MFGRSKVPAKAEPKKPRAHKSKGPDNNKRLAALEAKEAAAKATNADAVITTGEAIAREAAPTASLSQDYPLAFDLGRRARGAAIARDQAPFGAGDELDAWLEGYDAG